MSHLPAEQAPRALLALVAVHFYLKPAGRSFINSSWSLRRVQVNLITTKGFLLPEQVSAHANVLCQMRLWCCELGDLKGAVH